MPEQREVLNSGSFWAMETSLTSLAVFTTQASEA